MTHQKSPELLAPAGSFQACKAAVCAGADAVYAGGSQFGARAYAENFTQDQLLEAIDFVHLHGKKLYLTVNTLLKQNEMQMLPDYLRPYYLQGLDAVIVQDFGVMQLVREHFPDLAIHISTQMSAASACGFSYLQKQGAARVVAARELSLEEIREIRSRTEIEIECFVHGALCYCYSGQCLFSSMLGGRSGNRGRCAQPCRLPYTALDEAHHRLIRQKSECYPLSPKDLCTIEQVPELIEAGITSFKIEGRMKSAAYTAGVTAVYRRYIDQYLETGCADVREQDLERLLQTGNRSGFTQGYYKQRNGRKMIAITCPSHEKGQTEEDRFMEEKKIPVQAAACLKVGELASLTVSCQESSVTVRQELVQAAKNQPMDAEQIIAQLSKTGNTPFVMETVDVQLQEAVFLPKQALNQLRRAALEQLLDDILRRYKRTMPASSLSDQKEMRPECVQMQKHEMQPGFFTALIEAEIQLGAVLEQDFIGRIYLDSSMYNHGSFTTQLKEHVRSIHDVGKQAYLALPAVFRAKTVQFYQERWKSICESGIDGYLVRTQDELGFLDQMRCTQDCCVMDHGLYTYSNHTKICYAKAGWRYDTVPLELNKKELRERYHADSELIIYGHMPLMTSAQCIQKTFGRCGREARSGICYLKDRYAKEFPVRNVCSECYNIIYNPQPLSLIQLAEEIRQLQPASYRLWFTIEQEETVRLVLKNTKQAFLDHQKPDLSAVTATYTNGHYKRGAL